MPPKNRNIADACAAMNNLGFTESETKAALKQLLKVYANKWELIVDSNYSVLVDFILENRNNPEEKKAAPKGKRAPNESEPPAKRLCTRGQIKQAISAMVSPCQETASSQMVLCYYDSEESEECPPLVRKPRQRRQEEVLVSGNSLNPVQNCDKQPEENVNLICAGSSSDFGEYNADVGNMDLLEAEPWTVDNLDSLSDSSQFFVPSSPPKGELELSFIGHSSLLSDLCVSNFEQDIETLEQTSMKSYGAQNVLAVESHYHRSSSSALSCPTAPFVFQNFFQIVGYIPKPLPFGRFDGLQWLIGIPMKDIERIFGEFAERLKAFHRQKCLPLCKVEASHGLGKTSICIDDIARGEERVKISLEDGRNAEEMPPFFYIPHNLAYKNAHVEFSLACISEEGCCAHCSGDCLTSPVPCACATETGGQFAYTPGGLVEEKFLEECISLKWEPNQHNYYCSKCPVERSNGEINFVACRGHLARKFVKECWSKCGCTKNCGNRIVQRGITAKLQVFMTPEGKGWGLRTLEDLPRGAFVCEYVGEILTNTEVHERNIQSVSKEHTYFPVLLDAQWRSQGIMKDEQALCLDATVFGNVARFINHRCGDATLVEIPVEVQTPDRHYYHVALFTTRNVAAMEELTWDYGINLHDSDHGGKTFQCLCGSPLCPDRKDMNLDVPPPLLTYIRRRRRA